MSGATLAALSRIAWATFAQSGSCAGEMRSRSCRYLIRASIGSKETGGASFSSAEAASPETVGVRGLGEARGAQQTGEGDAPQQHRRGKRADERARERNHRGLPGIPSSRQTSGFLHLHMSYGASSLGQALMSVPLDRAANAA